MSGRGEPDDQDYVEKPEGGNGALTPQQQPPIQSQGGDGDFEVIETDERGEPIGGGQQPQPQDTRLTTDAAGERPVIQQPDDRGQQPGAREPRSARRQRERNARDERDRRAAQLEIENRQLSERLANVESFVTGVQPRIVELGEANIRQQLTNIDQQLAEENDRYRNATNRIAEAMQNADHNALTKALDERDTALVRKTQLGNTKAAVEVQLKRATDGRGADDRGAPPRQDAQPSGDVFRRDTRQQQQPGRQLSAAAQANVNRFAAEHPWYDGKNWSDLDSQTVLLIDKQVSDAGYDPSTDAYWDEVDRLIDQRMPWHAQQQHQDERPGQQPADQRRQPDGQQPRQQAQQQRRGPPTAAPSDRSPAPNGRRQVKITPARKEAMMLSGSIDSQGRVLDKSKYLKQLNSYEQYDKEHT